MTRFEDGDYLKYVVAQHGPDQEITQRGQPGEPTKPGEYVIRHGKAGDLLKAWKEKWEDNDSQA